MNLKVRLAFMNFLQFAVWGAYLTCMGIYLTNAGMSTHIGSFFAMQGIVSIFMPALMGIVADRWIPAQRLLGICHLLAGAFMMGAAAYGYYAGTNVTFATLFTLYSVSVAFYMPTLALSNSVAYSALTQAGMDTVKDFPPIRVFGTVGFICSMWFVDIMGFKAFSSSIRSPCQPVLSAMTTSIRVWSMLSVCVPSRCFVKRRWLSSSSFPCCWVSVCRSPMALPLHLLRVSPRYRSSLIPLV